MSKTNAEIVKHLKEHPIKRSRSTSVFGNKPAQVNTTQRTETKAPAEKIPKQKYHRDNIDHLTFVDTLLKNMKNRNLRKECKKEMKRIAIKFAGKDLDAH